jgi:hypothetical protein
MIRALRLGALATLAFPATLAAQAAQDTTGRLNLLFVVSSRPGMAKQLEEGFKRHAAWHARQRDTRSYTTSVGIFGADVGKYRVVYPNMRWEDLDRAAPIAQGDADDVQTNLAPYVESVVSRILNRSDALSRIPAAEPAKNMNVVTYFFLNPGKGPEFAAYLTRLKEAHDRANSTYRYFVLTQVSGADGPLFIMVRPVDRFAENTPPQTRQVLVAAFGELEADRLLNVQDEAVRRVESFITSVRPDLGYTPAGR